MCNIFQLSNNPFQADGVTVNTHLKTRLRCISKTMGIFLRSVTYMSSIIALSPCSAQTPPAQWQQPTEFQKPSDNWQKPGEIQQPGEIQKVVGKDGCRVTLVAASDALFEFDKSALAPVASDMLEQVEQSIAGSRAKRLRIRGHTDGVGSDAYNLQLSQKRAEAVRAWLSGHARSLPPITIQALGKTEPIAPNNHDDGSDNPEGRARNRRVEIVLELCDNESAK